MAEGLTPSLLNLTLEEKRLFGHLFRQADSDNIGVVTGEAAIKFFEKTELDPRILGEIWQIADKENRGLLTPAGFGIVLRLIGHYQAGRDPSPELALRPGPLPRFDNLKNVTHTTKQAHSKPPALEPQSSGSGPIRVPPLTPEKAGQYAALFENSGALGGVLPGEQAKQIFERAGLPNEILGRIWSLADTEQKGALEVTEFVIAMHLLASFKTGQMRSFPINLPQGLYEAASQWVIGKSAPGAAMLPSIPKQLSGSSLTRTSYSPNPPLFSQYTGSSNSWLISPSDLLKFDGIFKSLDKANRGYLTGDEAVPFFCESKLPEDVLAQIWDLADINSAGQLSREEFAVAMYLIRQQRAKRNGRESLPSTLPANLVPPSMRNKTRPSAVATAPHFETSASVLSKSAVEDLFDLDSLSSPTTISRSNIQTGEESAFPTSMREANLQGSFSNSPTQNTSTIPSLAKPFIPSSSFGQSLSKQATGTSKHSSSSIPTIVQPRISSDDLLGDNDPEISKMLTNETAELANLSTQVSTLSNQVQNLQSEKSIVENELTQSTSVKTELDTRLLQLRTLYERESKDIQILQERLSSSRSENQNLLLEMEKLEMTLKSLQNEHNQTVKSLNADQQENLNLKQQIKGLNSEIARLKSELEVSTIDARQQKGLVAINKKQLLTIEAERDGIKSKTELLNLKVKGDSDHFLYDSKVYDPKDSINLTFSTSTTTNPFFRRIETSSENQLSYVENSSIVSHQPDGSFQNLFGTSLGELTTGKQPAQSLEQVSIRTSSLGSIKAPFTRAQSTSENGFKGSSFFSSEKVEFRSLPNKDENPSSSENQQLSSDSPFYTSEKVQNVFPQDHMPAGICKENIPAIKNTDSDSDSTSKTPMNPGKVAARILSDGNQEIIDHSLSASSALVGANSSEVQSSTFHTSNEVRNDSEFSTNDSFGFKTPDRARNVKDDFDSAFASFGSAIKVHNTSRPGPAGGTDVVGFISEFPPIAELGDEDSDSSSEPVGFDDDFATASPVLLKKMSLTPELVADASSSKLAFENKDPAYQELSASPTANSLGLESNSVPKEVVQSSDLVTSKEISTSLSENPEITRRASETTQSGLKISSTPISQTTSLKIHQEDDFDEFDDLEDANEGDINDEFVRISEDNQSVIDDPYPVFDKSLSAKEVENTQQNTLTHDFQLSESKVGITSTPDDKHDWDAIFSGLETNESSLIGLAKTTTVADELRSRTNSQIQTEKALDETDLHDDPILKNLTGMGYQRSEALAALEKFDYDLEKAADFLASHS